jgi:aminomethyltransferase
MNQLPLHHQHEAAGAKLGEFAGYTMPLYYTKPLEEHHAVRREAGVFDISHMGQFQVGGPGAEAFLTYALPNDIKRMKDGDALYSPLCREDGGILDDLIVYRLAPARYHLIVNGATKHKDWTWLEGIAETFDLRLVDQSEERCLLAVQGPRAFERLAPHLGHPLERMAYYSCRESTAFGVPVFLARTGYTGEPGCEISMPREQADGLWRRITGELGIRPIGLAARDTLRLEAAMALYGHELREEWHPLETGLAWTVKLEREEDFVGKTALLALRATGYPYRIVGLEMVGRGIARESYPVLQGGTPIGMVTSGALSPTLDKAIALARVRVAAAKTGTPVQVEVRGKPVDAVVVPRPFYKNPALKA